MCRNEVSLEEGGKLTKQDLYRKQVELLRTFLEHKAITQEQYDKSYHDLTEKMGMEDMKI